MLESMYVDFNTMGQDLESEDPRVRIGRCDEHRLFREGQRVHIGDEGRRSRQRLNSTANTMYGGHAPTGLLATSFLA